MVIGKGWRDFMNKVLHPDRLLEKLQSNRQLLTRPDDCERLELYHRASSAMRVSREATSPPIISRAGFEEGVAVRLATRGRGTIAFAAGSGGDAASLQWAIERAPKYGGTPMREGGDWPLGEELLLDLDADGILPSQEEMISWLSSACELLQEKRGGWVEAVTTVESWVADGGPCASRCRTRGWAVAHGRPRPLILAARRWEELLGSGWADLAAERRGVGGTVGSNRGGQLPILFTAEAAADLVSALVRGYLAENECFGTAAGSGMIVADDPASPQALFGGLFDDATFPTERRLLADGSHVVAGIAGPGRLRRASFRDPPQSLPSHIVVEASIRPVFDGGLVVSGLTVHPLTSGEWVLEFEGSSGKAVEGFIRTDPRELVEYCVAGIGPSRLSHRGVLTPALLFEGLKAEL